MNIKMIVAFVFLAVFLTSCGAAVEAGGDEIDPTPIVEAPTVIEEPTEKPTPTQDS